MYQLPQFHHTVDVQFTPNHPAPHHQPANTFHDAEGHHIHQVYPCQDVQVHQASESEIPPHPLHQFHQYVVTQYQVSQPPYHPHIAVSEEKTEFKPCVLLAPQLPTVTGLEPLDIDSAELYNTHPHQPHQPRPYHPHPPPATTKTFAVAIFYI